MPFTLFHLGPALAVGVPLQRYLHAPTFIIGNVILDIEPLLVILLGLHNPLHGYFHTFLLAAAVGLLLGFVMFKLEGTLAPYYRAVKLEPKAPLKLRSFVAAGVLGAILHVLVDGLLYSGMQPFFPLTTNLLLGFHLAESGVYWACIWLGLFGVLCYLTILAYSMIKKSPKILE
jgi:hypothetical protein